MRKTASILCAFALVAATAGANENVTAKAAEDTYNVPSAPICVGAAINDRDSLFLLDEEPADNALIRAEYRDGSLFVVDGEGVELFLLSQVIEAFEVADVVPVIRFDNAETGGALADFLVDKNVSDAVVLSEDAALLKELRSEAKKVSGALMYESVAAENESAFKEICAEINSSWARVALLPNDVPEDLVDYLYERAVTVWICSDGTPEENYRAILKGAHGVISEDWAQTKADLATFTTPTLTRTPFVVGHGGMPVNYQPNSLRGFIDAYEAGADALENDLHMTKDGVVVLMHGTGVYGQEANGDFIDDIAAQTTGTGKIHELTWAQLQQYRIDGYKNLPTEPILDLDTYLREFADKPIKHYMELKRQRQTDMVAPVVELVKKYGMQDRMVFITYWDNVAAELRKQMPQCSVELLVDNGSVIVNDQGFEGLLEKLNPDNLAYSPNYRTFDTDQIAELAKRGILTYSWTYGTPGEFASAYAANRYSLTTDYALWAKELENEITFSKRSVTMGTSVDESVYFKGAVSTRSGQTRNNEIFSVRIIEGDIKLIRTANGKYYADRPGKAKAVVYYDSENRIDYSTDAGSGVQSLSYRLYSSEIVEIEVQGVTPALPGGGSSAGKSDPPASQGEAGEKTGGCGAFVERRTLLCFAACAIVLWTIGRKKEMRRK